MSEETELLRLILREPETGLEEAMRRYAPFVKAAAGRVLPGAPQEAEECMADTFIALWKNAGTLLDRQIPLKAWLAVTARNKALNRLRALRRQNALPLDETFAVGLDEAGPLAEDPAGEAGAAAAAWVAAQPPPDDAIFMRKYYLLQPSREIAAALGLTEQAVNTRLSRGRDRLRRHLHEEGYFR